MAKKKKKKHHKKRSRMSGAKGKNFMTSFAASLGVLGGAYLDKGIAMIPGADGLSKYIIGGGKVALGLGVVPYFAKGKHEDAIAAFGGGLAGVGGLNLLAEAGLLSGANDPLIVDLSESGSMNEDVLAGMNDLSVVNEDVLGRSSDLSVVNGMY
jgi:hypothetical protein